MPTNATDDIAAIIYTVLALGHAVPDVAAQACNVGHEHVAIEACGVCLWCASATAIDACCCAPNHTARDHHVAIERANVELSDRVLVKVREQYCAASIPCCVRRMSTRARATSRVTAQVVLVDMSRAQYSAPNCVIPTLLPAANINDLHESEESVCV